MPGDHLVGWIEAQRLATCGEHTLDFLYGSAQTPINSRMGVPHKVPGPRTPGRARGNQRVAGHHVGQHVTKAIVEGLFQVTAKQEVAFDATLPAHHAPVHIVSQPFRVPHLKGDHAHPIRETCEPLDPSDGETQNRIVAVENLGDEQKTHGESV